ncbi:non-specific lipid-transfer protein isoform X2 [Folsomia candida]|uniref:non-specific lipid-transfer protein isoform X2 n=1 Tax=Folsomia candida TaxID=158441 RepID=UPI000B8FF20C|nr:non-specific lipid-transfer protein isoform X2 [Folsomia candida]
MAGALRRVYVVGVGMTKFSKPGTSADYPEMAQEAVKKALSDAKLNYNEIEQACVGYVYGDSTCGQRSLYGVGMTGIPIYNVNNNCSTGSSALYLAKQLVAGMQAECVLALGFEKMEKGSLGSSFPNKTNPLDKHVEAMINVSGFAQAPVAAQFFGNAGLEHMKKYGTKLEHFAKIALKNHNHGSKNPKSQFQQIRTLEEIINSQKVHDPLTKLQCCPTSDGAAAAIIVSEAFVKLHNLQSSAVEILGMEMATDFPSSFEEPSAIKLIGYDMTKKATEKVLQKAGKSINDVQVIELHDCFSANELVTYEALGLCGEGKAGEFIDRGDNTYGGKYVVNPSGGLISKGHPLGATGLAQCAELCWQLRGEAEQRQVPGARLALQHNLGLGGAVVVALYQLGFPSAAASTSTTSTTSGMGEDSFKCSPVFKLLDVTLQEKGEELVKKVNGIYCFKVQGKDGKEVHWIVDVKNGKGKVEFQGKTNPDVTLQMDDQDLMDLMSGTLNAQKAFFQGKLKIKGNMALAMKLREFQTEIQKATAAKL